MSCVREIEYCGRSARREKTVERTAERAGNYSVDGRWLDLDLFVKEQKINAQYYQYASEEYFEEPRLNLCSKVDGYGDRDKCCDEHRDRGSVGYVLTVSDRIRRGRVAGEKAGYSCRRGVRGQKMGEKHHCEDAEPEAADPLYESRTEADEYQVEVFHQNSTSKPS